MIHNLFFWFFKAWRNWSNGNALRLLDSALSAADTNEVLRCINIALLCVQENASLRPIMSSVVLMLTSHSMTIPVPSRPAFIILDDPMDSNPPFNGDKQSFEVSIKEGSLSSSDS